jgi:hypothetical protein
VKTILQMYFGDRAKRVRPALQSLHKAEHLGHPKNVVKLGQGDKPGRATNDYENLQPKIF